MTEKYPLSDISAHIWKTKYRYRGANGTGDDDVSDTWRRVAGALAEVEPNDQAEWQERFYRALEQFRFLPGGRIQAGAGTPRRVTLFNCFVMGLIEDSMDGIFDALKEGAITMQQGGGIGYDFSSLRPRDTLAQATGTIASGPISFMRIWDSMCATILSTGARRGAMMATLRCDHPDIAEFVSAKQAAGELTHFNLSVQVTDAFMEAVRADAEWPLVFPVRHLEGDAKGSDGAIVTRTWPGESGPVECRVLRHVRARNLWDQIMQATYDYAEPGVLFVDRVNELNNLWYREHISATNPCGEIPLQPYGACDLGSINLTQFVREPFSAKARFDYEGVEKTARIGARILDNVIDASRFPLPAQAEQARGTRRIGLGLTGLGDALIMMGVRYDSQQARDLASEIMRRVCHAAYRGSIELAREKGAFPFFERERYLESAFVRSLPADIRDGIATHGVRNSHLLAIAPTGTVSLLANNVSSGLEPVYDFQHRRRVLELDGSYSSYELTDFAYRCWSETTGGGSSLPEYFADAHDIEPNAHLEMQSALQPYVDNAISKTINVPESFPFEDFRGLYERAYDKGLKGCTTYRPNAITGAVLEAQSDEQAPSRGEPPTHCCTIDREAD